MADSERRKVERSGAFLSDGFQNIPVPIRTLSDEYHDRPEPEDSDQVPEPEPEGLVTRAVHKLTGKHPKERD
ncbi:MAG: hypothetical protein ACYDAN_07775 [Candidatus Limnocylindrales bacterium]